MDYHLSKLFQKLDVSSRKQLALKSRGREGGPDVIGFEHTVIRADFGLAGFAGGTDDSDGAGSSLPGVGQVRRRQRLERHAECHSLGQTTADALAEDEGHVAVGQLWSGGHLLRQFLCTGEDLLLAKDFRDGPPGKRLLGRERAPGDLEETGTVQPEDLLPDDEEPIPGGDTKGKVGRIGEDGGFTGDDHIRKKGVLAVDRNRAVDRRYDRDLEVHQACTPRRPSRYTRSAVQGLVRSPQGVANVRRRKALSLSE